MWMFEYSPFLDQLFSYFNRKKSLQPEGWSMHQQKGLFEGAMRHMYTTKYVKSKRGKYSTTVIVLEFKRREGRLNECCFTHVDQQYS